MFGVVQLPEPYLGVDPALVLLEQEGSHIGGSRCLQIEEVANEFVPLPSREKPDTKARGYSVLAACPVPKGQHPEHLQVLLELQACRHRGKEGGVICP